MSFLFDKSRKIQFQLFICVHDLINLPYVSGNYHFRYKLKNAKGQSANETVKNHTVTWNHEFDSDVMLAVDKQDNLLPYELSIVIRQQDQNTNNFDDIGTLTINLAEHANELVTTKKYLLQNAKVNAATRITIRLKLLKQPDFSYKIPKAAQNESVVEELMEIVNDSGSAGLGVGLGASDPLFRASSISALKHFQGTRKDSHDDFVDKIFENARGG